MPRRRPRQTVLAVAACLCLVAVAGGRAMGIINPKFTPVHLVRDSGAIVLGPIAPASRGDEWRFKATETLKGRHPPAATLSLSGCKKDQVGAVRDLLRQNGGANVLLFAGRGKKPVRAYLSVAGAWLNMDSADALHWNVKSIAANMSATYAGGTDMLAVMCRYIVSYADASVPASVGASWMPERSHLGSLKGRAAGMMSLRWPGEESMYLFVAASEQDRLYRAADANEAFEDVTAASGLTSRSRQFTWADVSGDGRADLVSWDGRAVRVFRMGTGGALESPAAGQALKLKECLGLAPCSLPGGGRPAVLLSTPALPIVLHRRRDGAWASAPLPGGELAAKTGPAASACVVADLDNDGYWDVLQPRNSGGLLWRGAAGGFGEPERSNVACPGLPGRFGVADFNQDGYLDIFLSSAKANELWENDRAGRFVPRTRWAGSLNYKSLAGFSGCVPADLNHDGRTDLCLLHPKEAFTYHFNRGFRCFGEQGGMRLPVEPGAEAAPPGQAACASDDFNGDGSLDLAVAFVDGQVRCYYNDSFNKLLVRVHLRRGLAGPVTVSLWQRDKPPICMGTSIVSGRTPAACFAVGRPGECTVRWSLPGRPGLRGKITIPPRLPEGAVEVVLGEKAGELR